MMHAMSIIKKYIKQSATNIECEGQGRLVDIDLVLDCGAFNGSYTAGVLLFLKELELQRKIKIDRISGSSSGSILALLYLMDELDLSYEMYFIFAKQFKNEYNLNVFNKLFKRLKKIIITKFDGEEHFCKTLTSKLYITYYDIRKFKKITISSYASLYELFSAIRKSCHVPFIVNGNMLYKQKYMDGFSPYCFNNNNKTKKTLFVELTKFENLKNMLNITHEKDNSHRIIFGVIDAYVFFMKKKATSLCSYVIHGRPFIDYIKINLFENFICSIFYILMIYTNTKRHHNHDNI